MTNTPRIIQQLGHDHRNMAQLLDVLREELRRYKAGRGIDFEILSRIVDYVRNFPELRHHPREDLLFKHLKRRDPVGAGRAEAVIAEHEELSALTRKLSAALHNLQHGAEMPRPWFESLVDTYIATYRKHMTKEEESFFPLALGTLLPEDWRQIEDEASASAADPLFDGKIDSDYQRLHDRILSLAS